MSGVARPQPRNGDAERRERLRYDLLERLYLHTSGDCNAVADVRQLELELGTLGVGLENILVELERLGYVERQGGGPTVCLTQKGCEYVRKGAWRRRSVRD